MFWVKSPTGEITTQRTMVEKLPGDVDYAVAESYVFEAIEEFDKAEKQMLDKDASNGIIDMEALQKVVFSRITSRFQRKYKTYRPGFAKGQVEAVWETAQKLNGGKVYDPSGVEIFWDRKRARRGQWDMGHIPKEKYSTQHQQYMLGMMTDAEFKAWYQNPANYRPELPHTNRSHKYE